MRVSISLTLDNDAQSKANIVHRFFMELDEFVVTKKYGEGVLDFFIIFQIINPPIGFEHLHKDFKPKFTEHKSSVNKFTGELLTIRKQFSYSIKIQGELFQEFCKASENESRKILASVFLNSLSNFDALHKKVKDFDIVGFRSDMQEFFKYQNFVG